MPYDSDAAILEVSVQHDGPHHHSDMCGHYSRHLLRRVRFDEQRRRIARHVAARCTECASIRATGVCHATVSVPV